MQFADGVFATPSGRIEIACARAAADGHPRLPQRWSDPRPAAGNLRLLSPAHAWLLNTSFGNVRKIRTRLGAATIALQSRGRRGAALARGRDRAGAQRVRPSRLKVAYRTNCRAAWPGPQGPLAGRGRGGRQRQCAEPGRKSDMGESTAVHSVEVMVVRPS